MSVVPVLPALAKVGRVTQWRVALSEWTKIRSLRSTLWSLLVAVVLTIGLPILFSAVTASHWGSMSPHERADRPVCTERASSSAPTSCSGARWSR